MKYDLNPVTTAVTSTSSPLKFPALRSNIWLGVAVRNTRSLTEVLDGFPSILRTP